MRTVLDSIEEKGESLMRRAILVRGVHLGSSKQSLLDHSTTYGPINECILVINATGKGMSLALLIFKNQADTLTAVDKPAKFVNGSLTHAQFVIAGGCYPPPRIHPAGTEVYVNNLLPNHPSLDTLREEFLNYGDISFGPARDAMPPGFVYIIYDTPEGANAATQQPNKTVAGRPLFCSSTRDEVLKAARENVKGILDKYRTEALAAFSKPHPANTTVYITHVNHDCDPHKLKDLFAEFGESKRVKTRRKTLQVADERRPQPCSIWVFMVWNSPSWMFGVRHQRGLESLPYHHKDACVVVFSETLEQCFFNDFRKDGFSVEVVMPNLDELLEDTPVREFASLWGSCGECGGVEGVCKWQLGGVKIGVVLFVARMLEVEGENGGLAGEEKVMEEIRPQVMPILPPSLTD